MQTKLKQNKHTNEISVITYKYLSVISCLNALHGFEKGLCENLFRNTLFYNICFAMNVMSANVVCCWLLVVCCLVWSQRVDVVVCCLLLVTRTVTTTMVMIVVFCTTNNNYDQELGYKELI